MATYMTHLRVAEEINKKLNLHEESFIIGSMAPDSMICNEDRIKLNPPKSVTHWFDDNIPKIDSININAEKFYDEYLRNRKVDSKDKEFIFLLGYYIHLLTDIAWAKRHTKQKVENKEYGNKLKEDAGFLDKVKKDWYGIDFKYIRENENNLFNRIIMKVEDIPDYLDCFPKGAFIKKAKYIIWFYTNLEENFNKEFIYFTEEQMNSFINTASEDIFKLLKSKGIINNLN